MKLGIMQPYIFPYIGYFQLIDAVDKFVVYDDVTFIKQGWINRNNILLNGAKHVFTVPLKSASSFTLIRNTEINQNLFDNWRTKFLKTLEQAYSKAPYYVPVSRMVHSVLEGTHETIGELATTSIMTVCDYLSIQKQFVTTAIGYGNDNLKAKERVLDICKREQAQIYINPIGGKELYSKEEFGEAGVQLAFVRSRNITYTQFSNEFVPWLSIIDVLMFNSPEEVMKLISEYDLE